MARMRRAILPVVVEAPAVSLPELVAAAMRVGKDRAAFLSDWRCRHLTQEAWIEASVALSGMEPVALVELRARIEAEQPRLFRLCRQVADGWSRSYARDGLPPVDRPGPHGVFEDDEREPAAWVERSMGGITTTAASAVAGLLVAELGRDVWGRCSQPDEAEQQLQAWRQELARLQGGDRWRHAHLERAGGGSGRCRAGRRHRACRCCRRRRSPGGPRTWAAKTNGPLKIAMVRAWRISGRRRDA